jgi:hypothetical protein
MLIPILCGVVAVVALLGAFFLARSDNRTQVQTASPQPDTLAEKVPASTSASAQSGTLAEKASAPTQAVSSVAASPDPGSQGVSPLNPQYSQPLQPQVTRQFPQEGLQVTSAAPQAGPQLSLAAGSQLQLVSAQNSQPLSASLPYEQGSNNEIIAVSRHLYEIAGQVHILQRQSQEIERSLAQLSGVVEHLQQQQVHAARTSVPAGSIYANSQPYGETHL